MFYLAFIRCKKVLNAIGIWTNGFSGVVVSTNVFTGISFKISVQEEWDVFGVFFTHIGSDEAVLNVGIIFTINLA